MYSGYGYNLRLQASTWRHRVCAAQLGVVLVLFAVHPVYGWWWLLLWPWLFWCLYQLIVHWRQPVPASQCWLSEQGQLRWADDSLPAGQVLASSLISHYGVLLRWCGQHGKQQQLWLYQDNFSHADFRALCRVCRSVQWQGCAGPRSEPRF